MISLPLPNYVSSLVSALASSRSRLVIAIFLMCSNFTSKNLFADRVVVLKNGNTFSGQVTEQASRVMVKDQNRQLAFETRDVDMIVPTLHVAYERKAARISQPNIHAREKLLAWCMQQDLPEHAKKQLELLHTQHPGFRRLGLWQQRIDSHGKRTEKTVLPSTAPVHPDRQFAIDSEDRLTKNTQAKFVRKIQPILLNGCGLASCHGRAAQNSYKLTSGRSSLSRSVTQRNLGATLRQIGETSPDQSLLWISAVEAHGGAKKSTLSAAELSVILRWIAAVSEEVAPSDTRSAVARKPQESAIDPFDPAEFNALR